MLRGAALLGGLGSARSTHLGDEVSNVSRVRHHGPDRVLRLGAHGPLVHPPHPRGLAQHVLHGLRLLQLAEVVVLGRGREGVQWGPQAGAPSMPAV